MLCNYIPLKCFSPSGSIQKTLSCCINLNVGYLIWINKILQGNYKNDLLGLEFDPLVPGDKKLSGEYIIKHLFGISLARSKWFDLSIVFVLLIAYRILFFLILKFKERASPVLRSIYARTTIHHIMKRPSFQKRKSSFSSRNPPHHPMSSQEGLSSPLP